MVAAVRAVRAAMLAYPEAEWVCWVERSASSDLVMYGWEAEVYEELDLMDEGGVGREARRRG